MASPYVLLLALGLAPPAQAHESEPIPLHFEDSYDLSSSLEWDSGWQPKDSPLAIRLSIAENKDVEQGLHTELEGVSHLSWPESLSLWVEPVLGSGWFSLVTDLRIGADVQFELFGYTFFEEELWSYDLRIDDAIDFDPFLLVGAKPEFVELSGSGDPVEWDYSASVFTGVELGVNMDITPVGYAFLQGQRLEVEEATGELEPTWLETADTTALLPLPEASEGELHLLHHWVGLLEAYLALEFRPALDVCVVGACFEVLSFDIPTTLVEVAEERRLGPVDAPHPLPALAELPERIDFGEVEVGTLANAELAIEDLGALELWGQLQVDAAPFSVYPTSFFATLDLPDGAVVSFQPDQAGDFEGSLMLSSNDPLVEQVEILLVGTGVAPESDTDELPEELDDDLLPPDDPYITKTCGCSSPALPGLGWVGLGLGLLLLRRRSEPRGPSAGYSTGPKRSR